MLIQPLQCALVGLFYFNICNIAGGHLYAIGGPENILSGKTTQGYIIDINNGQLMSTFNSDGGFKRPHDIAISPNGTDAYVVELDRPYTLWKLTYGEQPTPDRTTTSDKMTNTNSPNSLFDKLLSIIGK